MQEKIEKILKQFWRGEHGTGATHACGVHTNASNKKLEKQFGKDTRHKALVTVEDAAAEIAALFEGKVIWEGEGQVRHYVHKTVIDMDHTDVPLYLKTKLGCKDGKRVRVVVKTEKDERQDG